LPLVAMFVNGEVFSNLYRDKCILNTDIYI
jgi:hypothetical protein